MDTEHIINSENLKQPIRIGIIGAGTSALSLCKHDGLVLACNSNLSPNLDEIAQKAKEQINMLSLPKVSRLIQDNIPSKLNFLIDLELTPEQIEYFKNSPPQRLEGETQEDYKNRRMINKLIFKFRGCF